MEEGKNSQRPKIISLDKARQNLRSKPSDRSTTMEELDHKVLMFNTFRDKIELHGEEQELVPIALKVAQSFQRGQPTPDDRAAATVHIGGMLRLPDEELNNTLRSYEEIDHVEAYVAAIVYLSRCYERRNYDTGLGLKQ